MSGVRRTHGTIRILSGQDFAGSLLLHLIDDVLCNLFSLATVRIPGPYNSVIAIADKLDSGLNLGTRMES
jgi:hypothetical protein